ncbi:MAG: diaminopimelate epimerase [Myxococcota bacterium]|nr:diaminopimelate epimerase [Myxococcota bacterium]
MPTFNKYHGLGNDFIILDERESGHLINSDLAKRLCDRTRGIGADGVLTILPSRNSDANSRLHIWNSDGSVAAMCGNGLRCVVAYLGDAEHVFDTDSGLRKGYLVSEEMVRVSVGHPKVSEEIEEIELEEQTFRGLRVDMGNPHFVLEPLEKRSAAIAQAKQFGAALESHKTFPDRSNIEFLAWDSQRLGVIVHERGAGLTQACGTGAGASFAALKKLIPDLSRDRVLVSLLGGDLMVDEEEGEIFIEGPAKFVFSGEIKF